MRFCIHCHQPQTATSYCSMGWYHGVVEHASYVSHFLTPDEVKAML